MHYAENIPLHVMNKYIFRHTYDYLCNEIIITLLKDYSINVAIYVTIKNCDE